VESLAPDPCEGIRIHGRRSRPDPSGAPDLGLVRSQRRPSLAGTVVIAAHDHRAIEMIVPVCSQRRARRASSVGAYRPSLPERDPGRQSLDVSGRP
jgi:hypothetical protein